MIRDRNVRVRRFAKVDGESRTQQHMAEECNINNIIKKFTKTGLVTHLAKKPLAYVDLPPPMDLQEAFQVIQDAGESFRALPSELRKRFDNDPVAFVAFAEDPKNRDELVELGLINPPRPADPQAAPAGASQRPQGSAPLQTSSGSPKGDPGAPQGRADPSKAKPSADAGEAG